jgi:hypothetical protein
MLSSKCPFTWFVVGSLATQGVIIFATYIRGKKRVVETPPALLQSDYAKELSVAIKLAYEAGWKIKDALDKKKEVSNKGSIDFVTDTDRNNEKLIFKGLKTRFPTHNFIGEVLTAVAPCTLHYFILD